MVEFLLDILLVWGILFLYYFFLRKGSSGLWKDDEDFTGDCIAGTKLSIFYVVLVFMPMFLTFLSWTYTAGIFSYIGINLIAERVRGSY